MAEIRDRIFKRIARRPFRWFLSGWLVLTILWLLTGFAGFEWTTHPIRPPPPQLVPYQDYLPGGVRYDEDAPIPIDVDRLPVFDPTLESDEFSFTKWNQAPNGPRLVGFQDSTQGRFGWPEPLLYWAQVNYYDVTDPTESFGRIAYARTKVFTTWRVEIVSRVWFIDGGTGSRQFFFSLDRFLIRVAQIELSTGFLVVMIWIWQLVSWRRRHRSGLCLNCSYDLQGTPAGDCPECGSRRFESVSDWLGVDASTIRMRFGRVFIAIVAFLVLVWVVQTVLTDDRPDYKPIDEVVSEHREEMEQEAAAAPSGTARVGWGTDGRDYGWPTPILHWYEVQGWEFAPGREPRPVAQGSWSAFQMYSKKLKWRRILEDPSRGRYIEFYWLAALEEFMALQFIALLLCGFLYGVLVIRARRSA